MNIWVDADACPVVIRDILLRAAERTGIQMTLVSNHALNLSRRKNVQLVQVASGFDEADNWIAARVQPGDLVITSDIPLADEIIGKGALALSTHGEEYTASNIKARLNIRDFMETMRSSGIQSGGAAPLNHGDRMQFANALDRILAKSKQNQKSRES